ncbi:MAG: CZB domain-containing protein [Holophagales bacterium]|nr:CZB domain-containing protein [Holophagales bacterium]
MDHTIYIHKLFNFIQPHLGVKEFAKVDHHNCRFGKWWETGLGKQEFSKTASYPKVEAPHAQVHSSANAIAAFGNDLINLVENEKAIADYLDAVIHGSKNVFTYIESMMDEKAVTLEADTHLRIQKYEEEVGLSAKTE